MDAAVLSEAVHQVGPYTLIRQLGVGGMGEVWVGHRRHESGACKTVAVKLLSRANDEMSQQMFDDEARLSMLLCNSNIVQVFDVGEDRGVRYMAMEWVDGLSLEQLSSTLRAAGQRLPLVVVGFVVGEILKALAYAHDLHHEGVRHCIVHRDVSPHNVMLSTSGEVKLMDFGIARIASEETSGAFVKGKLRYMPPEQLRGDSRQPTTDLFAVGAILHELIDGRRFRTATIDEARLYGMVLDGEIPPLQCSPERVPAQLDELRLGLLQARASERLQTARDAHARLSSWPDYRDAKFELQDLVRELVTSVGTSTRETTETGGSSTRVPTRSGSTTRPSRSHSTRAVDPIASRPRASVGLILGLATLSVIGFGVGLGWLVSSSTPTAEVGGSGERVEPEDEQLLEIEPPPDVGVAQVELPTAAPEVAPARDQPVQPEPDDREEPEEPDEPENRRAEPDEPDERPPPERHVKPRVELAVTAGGRFWVELELGRRTVEISRMKGGEARTRLRPGRYAVKYREQARGKWMSAGSVVVSESSSRIVLDGSGRATIE